jgi:hypothetical protein
VKKISEGEGGEDGRQESELKKERKEKRGGEERKVQFICWCNALINELFVVKNCSTLVTVSVSRK